MPVVLGGLSSQDYSRSLPPHSYINTEDYHSPGELAQYLVQLAGDKEEYNKYHAWRRKYTGRDGTMVF